MRSGVTPAGLRYAVRRSGRSVAYCALTIGCGTRNEAGYPGGIAHFVEHTLFRGTRRKSASVISSYLDRLGGELNAYTTKEEIVLHATVLKEDLGKAARLLFELATEATFPEKEIETERGVVIDEIISYKDNPAEDVYDRFESLLFEGSPLSTPILGTRASVKKITPEMLRAFVAEKFVPQNMVFTVVADIEEDRLEKTVCNFIAHAFPQGANASQTTQTAPEECFADASLRDPVRANALPQGAESTVPNASQTTQAASEGCFADASLRDPVRANASAKHPSDAEPVSFYKVVDKRHHEVNAVIGCRAPSLYEMPDRLVCAMLANMLGGPASNSLLNAQLREKRGWVYGIECSYTQYADTGILAITFGCDRPNLEGCTEAIDKMLKRLQEIPFTDRQLKAYRKQLLGQLAISNESGEAQCLSMGKSMMAWGDIASPEEVRAQILAITPAQMQEMARRLFGPGCLSTLVYL